jgi:hypothetical protein
MAMVWTFGYNAGSQTEVKIKRVFMTVHEIPRLWRKLHPKFSVFQRGPVEGAGMLYEPACQVACKRNSWAVGPHCS